MEECFECEEMFCMILKKKENVSIILEAYHGSNDRR